MGAYFYIKYLDGKYTEIEFNTAVKAKKAYMLYDREPECTAKAWGWDTKYETPTLAQQIRRSRQNQMDMI